MHTWCLDHCSRLSWRRQIMWSWWTHQIVLQSRPYTSIALRLSVEMIIQISPRHLRRRLSWLQLHIKIRNTKFKVCYRQFFLLTGCNCRSHLTVCIQGCRIIYHNYNSNNNPLETQAYHVSEEVLRSAKCWLNMCVLRVLKSSRANVRVQTCQGFTETIPRWICVCECVCYRKNRHKEMKRRCSSILMNAYSCYCSFRFINDVPLLCFYFFQSGLRPSVPVSPAEQLTASLLTASFPVITPCDQMARGPTVNTSSTPQLPRTHILSLGM